MINKIKVKETSRGETRVDVTYVQGEDIFSLTSMEEPLMSLFEAIQKMSDPLADTIGLSDEYRGYLIVSGCSFKDSGEDEIATIISEMIPPDGLAQNINIKVKVSPGNHAIFAAVKEEAMKYVAGDRRVHQQELFTGSEAA